LRKKKKAQIKMFETIAVLVIFFFLLIFGMSFYFKLQQNSLQKQIQRTTQLQTIQIAQRTAFLPELDCVLVGVQRENCFDTIKLQKFNDILQDPQAKVDYFSLFQSSTIQVREVFPNKKNFTLYDRPVEGPSTFTQIPMLLFDSVERTYSFGVLEVRVYES
jgi:hypothetical protein